MSASQFTWSGDKKRGLSLCRPCSCGCDIRDKPKDWSKQYIGYLTGSDAKGNGFTIWIEDEKVFKVLDKILYPKSKKVKP